MMSGDGLQSRMAKSLRVRVGVGMWVSMAVVLVWWFLSGQYDRGVRLHFYDAPRGSEWICVADSSQYTSCFRKDFDCLTDVQSAWVGVVSEGGFELMCNGNPVGAQTYWRPTRGFQNGLTESGQKVIGVEPLIAYNFPREYQWSGHANEKMVVFFDLGPFLKKGKNVLCVESEARTVNPAMLMFGEVVLRGGEVMKLYSDGSWRAEAVPVGMKQNDWMMPLRDVRGWRNAVLRAGGREFVSSVPVGIFGKGDVMQWVHGDGVGEFYVDDVEGEGGLRVLAQSDYWLWVNGDLVEPARSRKSGYNGGEWDITWEGRRPLSVPPVLLDPDEASSFFAGERFADPRHGDPTENDFKRYENTQNRTRERPNQTGDNLTDDGDEERGRLQDPYGFLEEPEAAVPHSLLRQRNKPRLQGFDVSGLLRQGVNTVRVKMVGDGGRGRFALGGLGGLRWEEGVVLGKNIHPKELPVLKYMGRCGGRMGLLSLISIWFLLGVLFSFVGSRMRGVKSYAVWVSVLLILAVVLEWSFGERSEVLWFYSRAWGYCVVGVVFVLVLLLRFLKLERSLWSGRWLCCLLLLLVFITRAWQVDEQPIDDDEYASIQAVLSIAETGKPKIADEIWYSRSPLYHYGAAAVVRVFGPNIWSLRLYSVILSVGTGLLIWLLAMRYFRDSWMAALCVLIFAMHPFLIFSGHIARFYQQQQFMVLLLIHLFIEGFLNARSVRHRVGAILVFAMAVLSQEISISFVPVFLVLYVMFGRGVPVKWDVKSVFYMIFAGVLVVGDVALFQVKCLTRSVGVSPNVEATLAPTFWELGNLFSMFIGYSRLHVVLSFFYVLSLMYSLRRGASRLITLHLMLLVSVVAFNLIITSVSFRYMYSIIPLWILLGVHGVSVLCRWVASQSRVSVYYTLRWCCAVVIMVSLGPWRVVGSYGEKILGDPITSLSYVKSELRADDKVMITEPHPHAAKIELGRVDYDLVVPILYDFTYNKNGVLRDRNGDAVVVNRLAQLQDILRREKRVWIILNREKFRSRKKNIRWEYPGAREELFIRKNCDLKFRSYLWSVYLWDSGGGELYQFRRESNSWVE